MSAPEPPRVDLGANGSDSAAASSHAPPSAVRARRQRLAQLLAARARRHLPLSYDEERLWVLHQLEPESPAYNMTVAAYLDGELDRGAFERSLAAVARRQEILRTRYLAVDGRPVKVVDDAAPLALAVDDLSGLPPDQRDAAIARLAREDGQQPFDLARGPLARVRLLRFAEQEHALIAVVHHLVCDGVSTGVFLSELATNYLAARAGQPSPLPDLPIQYADFARWQRAWLNESELERRLAYWRDKLRGLPESFQLPADFPRRGRPRRHGVRLSRTLVPSTVKRLDHLAMEESATRFMVVLGAFNVLLGCAVGRDDVVIGTNVSNRRRAETEGLMGFFVNQLVLRTDLSASSSFRDVVRRTRQTCLEAYEHQDVPFDVLVRALSGTRDPQREPLFQVKLIPDPQNLPSFSFATLRLRPIAVDPGIVQNDLTAIVGDEAEGVVATFWYDADLFASATMEGLLAQFQTVLDEGSAAPDAPLRALMDRLRATARARTEEALQQSFRARVRGATRASLQP